MATDPSGHGLDWEDVEDFGDDIAEAGEDVVDFVEDIDDHPGVLINPNLAAHKQAAEKNQESVIKAVPSEVRPYVGTAVTAVLVASGIGAPIAGAIGGGISSYLAGGSFTDVLLSGGISFASGYVGGGIADLGGTAAEIIAGAVSGALSGGSYATIYGGNVFDAAWQGAVAGGAGAAAANFIPSGTFEAAVAAGALGGAVSSGAYAAVSGGSIGTAMLKGAAVGGGAAFLTSSVLSLRFLSSHNVSMQGSLPAKLRTGYALRNLYNRTTMGRYMINSAPDVGGLNIQATTMDLSAGHAGLGNGSIMMFATDSIGIGPEHPIRHYPQELPSTKFGLEVFLGHEMGHAVLGLDDPLNVSVAENPIRADLGVQRRPAYHGRSLPW